MGAYQETMFILKKYNIMANKSLGQNFLISDDIIDKIVNSAEITKSDLVIEIGPGLGTLTKELLEKAGKVIAIELDKRMIKILQDRFALYNNFEIINEDVLKVDLHSLIEKEKKMSTENRSEMENRVEAEDKSIKKIENVKIVANLPYYITTPIIMKLLEEKLPIHSITVMVQKEVAQRLTAKPGTKLSGAITYSVNYYSEPNEIAIVPNTSFVPEPEVESEVIKLNIREQPAIKIENEELFFKLIKVSFMQRRKTLINGITNSELADKEKIREILKELGIDERTRGENLTLEEFEKIAEKI